MKFIHTADVHWGMTPDSGSPWSQERYQAIKDTFTQIITKTRDEAADCLFISGDLFHRQPMTRDLKEINYLFTTIPNVRVVIIAGNHDRIRPSSALLSFSWSPNVTFLMSGDMTSVCYEEINTQVHGFSYHSNEINENLIDGLKAPNDGRIHVLMVHGGDSNHLPFDKKALLEAGFSYVALGHIHKPEIMAGGRMAYPGSPEPLDKNETGAHGILRGEIHPLTHKMMSLDFIPLCKAQYVPLAVNITTSTTNSELDIRMSQEIEDRGKHHLYRFRVCGMRDPDLTFDFENLKSRYRIVDILDQTEPQYDFRALFKEHPGDMIGFYIQALQKNEMSPVEKKALYYGIDALLRTTDERS